jgi:hypothetical protein
MVRLWARLRALQSEFRNVASVEVRHDLSREFGRVASEYVDAVAHSRLDPTKDIAGIAEILAVNDEARRQWEAENAAS